MAAQEGAARLAPRSKPPGRSYMDAVTAWLYGCCMGPAPPCVLRPCALKPPRSPRFLCTVPPRLIFLFPNASFQAGRMLLVFHHPRRLLAINRVSPRYFARPHPPRHSAGFPPASPVFRGSPPPVGFPVWFFATPARAIYGLSPYTLHLLCDFRRFSGFLPLICGNRGLVLPPWLPCPLPRPIWPCKSRPGP